ncbi:MAG TPA: hypothetical protein DHV07_02210 [Flavobacteriales bacterium]|nr:hypothetical protein [Flavobacteriales bacterium]
MCEIVFGLNPPISEKEGAAPHFSKYPPMKSIFILSDVWCATRCVKKLFCGVFFCFLGSNVLAQQAAILKVSVSDPLAGRYSMGLEKPIAKGLSVAVEWDYLNKEVFLESEHPWYMPLTARKKGFVCEPQVRLYRGEVLSGTYISLGGFFGLAEYTTETGWIDNSDWSSVGVTCHIGHQLRLGRLVLDGYAGCTWADDEYPLPYWESTALFPPPNGLRFSGGLRLGIGKAQ